MIILIVLGNIFNICVLLYNNNLRNVTGSFMVALACADLSLGLFGLPFMVRPALEGRWVYTKSACDFCGFISTTLIITSVLLLFDLSVDRYIWIAKPVKHYKIMTGKRCAAMIASSWLVAAVYSATPFFGWGSFVYNYKMSTCTLGIFTDIYFGTAFFAISLPPIFAMCFLNLKILRIARRQTRTIRHASQIPRTSEAFPVTSFKPAMTVGIVVTTCVVSLLPLIVSYTYSMFSNNDLPSDLVFAFTFLLISNSFWNCIIYSATNTTFRQGAKKFVLRVKKILLDLVSECDR
ncbi:histamine H2 receptor-like [Branchiostoma floridae]|uniref:Histamine H2 receptor-like n=1 Tax=Branchiostoma floridae TaxID=7739 RepID=A0A9J7M3N5_BRAFL|nr:histamine H2 receptor-like [Branchiostoma floridae]